VVRAWTASEPALIVELLRRADLVGVARHRVPREERALSRWNEFE